MASRDKQIEKNHHFGQSLKHALTGLFGVYLREGNFRREGLMALVVFVFAWVFKVGRFQWFILLLAVMLVFLMELWNTIIENVVDLVVGHQFDERAKRIKDMSAGAVLVASGIAVVCGLYVFLPPLWQLLTSWG